MNANIIPARAETSAHHHTTDSDDFALIGEMSVREWNHWRRRLRALRMHCRSAERGFLRGQLYRLDRLDDNAHPVYAQIAVPPSEYAIARIEWIERRGATTIRRAASELGRAYLRHAEVRR